MPQAFNLSSKPHLARSSLFKSIFSIPFFNIQIHLLAIEVTDRNSLGGAGGLQLLNFLIEISCNAVFHEVTDSNNCVLRVVLLRD